MRPYSQPAPSIVVARVNHVKKHLPLRRCFSVFGRETIMLLIFLQKLLRQQQTLQAKY